MNPTHYESISVRKISRTWPYCLPEKQISKSFAFLLNFFRNCALWLNALALEHHKWTLGGLDVYSLETKIMCVIC